MHVTNFNIPKMCRCDENGSHQQRQPVHENLGNWLALAIPIFEKPAHANAPLERSNQKQQAEPLIVLHVCAYHGAS